MVLQAVLKAPQGRRALLAFLAGVAVVLAGFSAAAAEGQKIHQFTLENGLRVVLAPDFRSPVVVHMVWYNAGAVDEPTGKTGIAHMLEHMMFKGTDTVPPGEFSKKIATLGGQDNAFTSSDYTAYYQKVARDNLSQAVALEADRIANLNISNATFQPERDVILEERNTRVDSRPISVFFEKLSKVHMPNHPYGNPVIGWRKDIENYTLKDAQDWYKQFYAPQNAQVIFTGALALDEAKWLAKRYYGDLENPAVKPTRPTIVPEPLFTQPKRFTHRDKRTQLPLWARFYRAPSLHEGLAGTKTPEPEVAAGLVLLSEVLGGGLTSHLYQHLVVEQELADAAQTSYNPLSRHESQLEVVVQPKPGAGLKQVEAQVDAVIKAFIENGLTDDVLARAKMQAKSADVFARDDLFEAAYRLGAWVATGGQVEGYKNWLNVLESVSVEDVQNLAKKYLVLGQSTTGMLLPE